MSANAVTLNDVIARLKLEFFLPYQVEWIEDESKFKAAEKSRRVGYTFATSFRAVWKCLRKRNHTQWVSSRDQGTAREFVTDYVAKWCAAANLIAPVVGDVSGLDGGEIQVLDPAKDIRAFVVTFGNGSRILSLSSSPHAFAGKGGDILLDEVDLHDDQATLIAMAGPCTMWGGQLEMVSAYDPAGSPETAWATLIEECKIAGNPKDISLHRTTLDDAIACGLVEKINETKGTALSREEFKRQVRSLCRTQGDYDSQYDCIPNRCAGNSAVRPEDLSAAKRDYPVVRIHFEGDAAEGQLVDPCVQAFLDGDAFAQVLDQTVRYSVGYDVARNGHLASAWINRIDGRMATLEILATFHRCKFGSQKAFIRGLLRDFRLAVGAGDSTGLGMNVCEDLVDEFTERRFLAVNFSASKPALGALLTEIYENGEQIIPAEPREIGADVYAIKLGVSAATKKAVYIETANPLNELSHADMGWSNALALHADRELPRGAFAWEARGSRAAKAPSAVARHPLARILYGSVTTQRGGCQV